jgi:Uma2 family endonuclease
MNTSPVAAGLRWTIHDLEAYPIEEGKRYEIIEGELLVSTQPHIEHQRICARLTVALSNWAAGAGGGEVIPAPGVIFDPENAVAPDVVWVSPQRLPLIVGEDGKLHDAPDLAIEVLSPGTTNTRRDRELKLRLYSLYGVREYWIIDWPTKSLQIYRREAAALKLAATLLADDDLTSPLLPGLSLPVARLF